MISRTPFVWHNEVIKLPPTPKKWNFWAIHLVENNCFDFFGGENWGSYSWNWVFILFLLYSFCWYKHTGRLVWNTQYISSVTSRLLVCSNHKRMVTTTQQPGVANLEIDVELAEECICASVSFGTRTKQSATEETTMGKSIALCTRGGKGANNYCISPAQRI